MANSTLTEIEPRTDEESMIGLGTEPAIPVGLRMPHARHGWYLPVKCAIEWVLAVFLLIVFSPVLALLAVLVKVTSPGPALYTQTRLGCWGRLYKIYKLRTMRHDAELQSGPVWAAKGDVRITPLGRLLRDTHLDELPQLWNVICGEMSLIGPRPERPEIAARISRRVPGFGSRLAMRPGVTGLAQMLVPADDPEDADCRCVRRKLGHDLVYLREVSPLLDLKITVSTSCYFFAAAVDAVRRSVLRSYGKMAEAESHGTALAQAQETELEQGAA